MDLRTRCIAFNSFWDLTRTETRFRTSGTQEVGSFLWRTERQRTSISHIPFQREKYSQTVDQPDQVLV